MKKRFCFGVACSARASRVLACGDSLRSLVLPVIALSLFGVTAVAKQARDSALDVLDADYVRVLRGNGVSETRIVLKHVLRNAAIPVVTVLGYRITQLLAGAVKKGID